ncbi:MAG TPA: tetratricopeptide repeat protein [Steroidobacteraceae bacterium]|nr:tetratricopeptide repeat protein [Steroidobacteraceae bacterium]
MHRYSMRDVERVLQLPRSTLQGLVRLGFVHPSRGPRRQYLFSFQDLIILRAARALMQANISRRRIRSSLGQLRDRLPEAVPLSGLAICAVGDRVVVREGANHWQADDGQYLLGFEVSMQNGILRMIEHARSAGSAAAHADGAASRSTAESETATEPATETDWFAEGLQLEGTDPAAALAAYSRAAEGDPDNSAAWINWGRLLHERGDARAAEKVYRRALEHCGADALLLFNLGVALEDLGEKQAALAAYHSAISEDPNLADGHYNLARLYESAGKTQHAIRHLGQYRRLVTRNEH